MPEVEFKVKGYQCLRCGHKWQPKKKELPMTCPNCRSPYWNKPKKS